MFHKGLWFQHYKQSKYILWAFWLVAALGALLFYNHAGNVASDLEYLANRGKEEYHYHFGVDLELISSLQLLLCIGLSALLIGFRRTNHSLELTYALPIKRKHIYLSKWMLGIVHIIGASTFGLFLQLVVVHTTVLNDYLPDSFIWTYYVHQVLILSGVYSFSLWVGMITGSLISQAVLSTILLLLPAGLYVMINGAASLHLFAFGVTDIRGNWFFNGTASRFFESLSFPVKLLNINSLFLLTSGLQDQAAPREYLSGIRQSFYGVLPLLISVLVTAGSVWGMIRMAAVSGNENNGKLLLIAGLRPYLIACMGVYAFLFGGMILEGMLGNHNYTTEEHQRRYMENLVIYYMSGVASAGIAILLLKKMLGDNRLLKKSL